MRGGRVRAHSIWRARRNATDTGIWRMKSRATSTKCFRLARSTAASAGFPWRESSRSCFDDAQNLAIPADQVEFPAMLRRAKIAGNDAITAPPKLEISFFLASPASAQVLGGLVGRRKRFSGNPIEGAPCGLPQAARHMHLQPHPSLTACNAMRSPSPCGRYNSFCFASNPPAPGVFAPVFGCLANQGPIPDSLLTFGLLPRLFLCKLRFDHL